MNLLRPTSSRFPSLWRIGAMLLSVALVIGFWGAIIYVVHHFIVKYW